jgi:SAM domain (Sterile alpha motif)
VLTIGAWLASLGMSEYAARFVENRIDLSVLPELTDQDLKKLGVLMGDRRKCCGRSAISGTYRLPLRPL